MQSYHNHTEEVVLASRMMSFGNKKCFISFTLYVCDNIMNLANQNAISFWKYVHSADHLLCDCDTCAIRFLSYTLLICFFFYYCNM